MSGRFALLFAQITLITLSTLAQAASTCSGSHANDRTEFRRIHAEIKQLLQQDYSHRSDFLYSKRRQSTFVTSGLPFLLQRAKELDTTLVELFGDPIAMFGLLSQKYPSFTWNQHREREMLQALQMLSNFSSGQKLKAAHWRQIRAAMAGVYHLGLYLNLLESKHYLRPTFHPFAEHTADHLERLFDTLERLNFDMVLDDLSRPPRLRDHSSTPPSQPEKTDREFEIPNELPTYQGRPQVLPTENEVSLAVVLSNELPLDTEKVYQGETIYRRQLEIQFDAALIKQMSDPMSDWVIRRLLRSLLMGNGSSAGLKTLFDLGPGIVEIKGFTGGHKRIFGCLDGSRLVLRKLMSIPATRAAYARRIPSHFCK